MHNKLINTTITAKYKYQRMTKDTKVTFKTPTDE